MAVIAAICSCVLIAGGELCTPWYSIGLSCDKDVHLLHLKFRTDRPRPPLPTDVLSWKNVHHYKLFVLSIKFASMFNCHPTLIKPIQHPWWKLIGPMTTHGEMSISWQSITVITVWNIYFGGEIVIPRKVSMCVPIYRYIGKSVNYSAEQFCWMHRNYSEHLPNKHKHNAVFMLGQRRIRWANIETALYKCLVFARNGPKVSTTIHPPKIVDLMLDQRRIRWTSIKATSRI